VDNKNQIIKECFGLEGDI